MRGGWTQRLRDSGSRRVAAAGSRAVHPNLFSAPQRPLPRETCSVLPAWDSIDPVLKMSLALKAPVIVIVVPLDSKGVSAEGRSLG